MQIPVSSNQIELSTCNVLIINTNPRMSKLLRDVLHGWKVKRIFTAIDTKDALFTLKNHAIDLIISEWGLRPIDTKAFVKFLRSSPDSPARLTPILLTAVRPPQSDINSFGQEGLTEFMGYPFALGYLKEYTRHFITRHQAARESIAALNTQTATPRMRASIPLSGRHHPVMEKWWGKPTTETMEPHRE